MVPGWPKWAAKKDLLFLQGSVFHSPVLHTCIYVVENSPCHFLLCSSSWGEVLHSRHSGQLGFPPLRPSQLSSTHKLAFLIVTIPQSALSPSKFYINLSLNCRHFLPVRDGLCLQIPVSSSAPSCYFGTLLRYVFLVICWCFTAESLQRWGDKTPEGYP